MLQYFSISFINGMVTLQQRLLRGLPSKIIPFKKHTIQIIKLFDLKEQGHVTANKPVISRIYVAAHMWPLCSAQIMVDGVNPH